MKSKENFSITDMTNGMFTYEGLPFCSIKKKVLGENYSLSLVFADEETSKKLNTEYRSKEYPTNILSFPLDEKSGEVFICIKKALKESSQNNMEISDYILFLFIHGIFHLKGFDHGEEMEAKEKEIREIFNIPQPE